MSAVAKAVSTPLGGPAAQRSAAPIAGRDARLPSWLEQGRPVQERPKYDSAVVVGNGIGALCAAARLARSETFAGRVVIAGTPPEQGRRLLAGLTLRARSLDYFAACLGVSRSNLLERLYEGQHESVASNRQVSARFTRHPDGRYELGRMGEWMSRWKHQGRVVCYGVRNSHMAGTIHDFMDGLDYRWEPTRIQSINDCYDLAPGSNPIILNTLPFPLAGAGGLPSGKPKNFVVAAQLPFSAPRQLEKGVLPLNTSLFSARRRAGRMDASVWYPLRDPLSPTARYYGIFYRIVRGGPALHKNAEIEVMKDHLFGLAEALGFEAVDPDETLGTAMIPTSSWSAVRERTPGYLHLYRLANGGTPIIAGDGMCRSGLASYVAAEAILAGEDPQDHVNRALFGWKQRNRLAHHLFARQSWAADAGLRWMPGEALGLIQDFGETWAGVEKH